MLQFAKGTDYWVKLTAYRGTLNDSITHKFSLCPSPEELKLTYNDENSYTWILSKHNTDPVLSVAPYGGQFSLTDSNNKQLDIKNLLTWQDDHESVVLNLNKNKNIFKEEGVYILTYGIDHCSKATFTLTVQKKESPVDGVADGVPANDKDVSQPGIPKTVFNKRLLDYRKALEQIGKDSKLKKLKRFGITDSFFLTPSVSQPAKALQNFGTAYKKLLTAFNDTKEKITDAQSEQVAQLLMNATAFYLDKLVALSPLETPGVAIDSVKKGIELMKSLKASPDALLVQWKPSEIQSDQNKDTIKAYQALFV